MPTESRPSFRVRVLDKGDPENSIRMASRFHEMVRQGVFDIDNPDIDLSEDDPKLSVPSPS